MSASSHITGTVGLCHPYFPTPDPRQPRSYGQRPNHRHTDTLCRRSVGHLGAELSLLLRVESQAVCLQSHQLPSAQPLEGIVTFFPHQGFHGRKGLPPCNFRLSQFKGRKAKGQKLMSTWCSLCIGLFEGLTYINLLIVLTKL